ncbi:hypothetical protein BKA82DRAFT_1007483 [Pisolithus tinctorius]|uniref:Uncharacterized protein n=1 Tax=Pisolithus tinctorius Marx 270 TaxID=870435 RepID=A0A0C3IEI9_PISTI|nr:hypothetical protein BKA82DRAFT_1007483 [Pisolithus tinctorius]KIN95442.1 hypothetical protein M404DRAFT_1007483 [Pisolithus tinctorius Marx 270]
MKQFNKLPEEKTLSSEDLKPLAHPIALSCKRGYPLGVRLVHGAYHPHEVSSHSCSLYTKSTSKDPDPLLRSSKVETDTCYNTRVIANDLGSSRHSCLVLASCLGHDWGSSGLVLRAKSGLAREECGVNEPQTVIIR